MQDQRAVLGGGLVEVGLRRTSRGVLNPPSPHPPRPTPQPRGPAAPSRLVTTLRAGRSRAGSCPPLPGARWGLGEAGQAADPEKWLLPGRKLTLLPYQGLGMKIASSSLPFLAPAHFSKSSSPFLQVSPPAGTVRPPSLAPKRPSGLAGDPGARTPRRAGAARDPPSGPRGPGAPATPAIAATSSAPHPISRSRHRPSEPAHCFLSLQGSRSPGSPVPCTGDPRRRGTPPPPRERWGRN